MSSEHIAEEFKDEEGNSIVSASGGTAGVDEIIGRRYAAVASSFIAADQFTMVADRMYTFFRPIPLPKTYAKISAIFGPDGATFSVGAQARLGAYAHVSGAPAARIAEVLITDAILTGGADVLADMVLSIPATAPGIFLTVMADRALKLAMMNEDGMSTLQLLGSMFTAGVAPVMTPASADFGQSGSNPDNNSEITLAVNGGASSQIYIFKTTPGSPPVGTTHVQIGANPEATALNFKNAVDTDVGEGDLGSNGITTQQVAGTSGDSKIEISSTPGDVTLTATASGGEQLNATLVNEQIVVAVPAKLDPQFMLNRDLGAFGNLPDPHGVGTLQPAVSSAAAPGIMLEP